MEIEVGEYFVVSRGIQLIEMNFPSYAIEAWKQSADQEDKPPRYDRSYNESVFKALAVEYPLLLGEYAWGPTSKSWLTIGDKRQFNLNEIEIMTLGREYVTALGLQSKRKEVNDGRTKDHRRFV